MRTTVRLSIVSSSPPPPPTTTTTTTTRLFGIPLRFPVPLRFGRIIIIIVVAVSGMMMSTSAAFSSCTSRTMMRVSTRRRKSAATTAAWISHATTTTTTTNNAGAFARSSRQDCHLPQQERNTRSISYLCAATPRSSSSSSISGSTSSNSSSAAATVSTNTVPTIISDTIVAPVDSKQMKRSKTQLKADLKQYRLQQSAPLSKPAYTVFTNAALDEIYVRLPTTMNELLDIKGIGPKKLDMYGTDILSIVAQYTDVNGGPRTTTTTTTDTVNNGIQQSMLPQRPLTIDPKTLTTEQKRATDLLLSVDRPNVFVSGSAGTG